MNNELEYGGTVTTERCRTVVVIGTGGIVNGVEERNRLTFQYILVDGVEVRLVNGEDERMDAITTVLCRQRITVDTLLGEVLTLIEVVRTLTDRYTCGIEDRIVDNELQSVEHLLTVDVGRIVAVETRCIERCHLSVPLVDPLIGQIVRTNDHGCIYHRVYDHLDVCDGVTAVRSDALDGMHGVFVERESQYGHRLTFEDMTLNVVVVRFVHREVEDGDRVTSVRSYGGVTIDTGLGQVLSLEGVESIIAFADTIVDSNHNRIVNNET